MGVWVCGCMWGVCGCVGVCEGCARGVRGVCEGVCEGVTYLQESWSLYWPSGQVGTQRDREIL